MRASGWLSAESLNQAFFPNGQPGVAAELFREACEDYEYLYLANGGAHPRGNLPEAVDRAALSLGFCLTVSRAHAFACRLLIHWQRYGKRTPHSTAPCAFNLVPI